MFCFYFVLAFLFSVRVVTEKINDPEDRFQKDLDDKDWHTAHLKFLQLDGRRDCKGETYEDKVRRYIKMLKSDASLVEFVSADPLPFNKSDLFVDRCVEVEFDDVHTPTIINSTTEASTPIKSTAKTESDASKVSLNTEPLTATTESVKTVDKSSNTETISTATTTDPKPQLTTAETSPMNRNNTKEDIRRSEYLFSSVEYYDDVVEFDSSKCSDAVEEISLEIDQLRLYDVECEAMLEWQSLHDHRIF